MNSKTYVPSTWCNTTVPNNIRKKVAIDFLMQRNPTFEEQISAYFFLKCSTDLQTGHDIYSVLVDRIPEKIEEHIPLNPMVQKLLTQLANALLGVVDCNKVLAMQILRNDASTKCEQVVAYMLISTVCDKQTGDDIYGILVDQLEVLQSAVKKKLRAHADLALNIGFPMIKESARYQVRSKKKKKAA